VSPHQDSPVKEQTGYGAVPRNFAGSTQLFEIVDSEELSRRLTVPDSWVREHTRARCTDPIPHVRLGKYVRFRWGSPELEDWVARRIVSSSNRVVGRALGKESK
jgi:hypothetical protein